MDLASIFLQTRVLAQCFFHVLGDPPPPPPPARLSPLHTQVFSLSGGLEEWWANAFSLNPWAKACVDSEYYLFVTLNVISCRYRTEGRKAARDLLLRRPPLAGRAGWIPHCHFCLSVIVDSPSFRARPILAPFLLPFCGFSRKPSLTAVVPPRLHVHEQNFSF